MAKGCALLKKKPRFSLILTVGLAGACFLSGCLYTTHHFNSGRLLEAGRTSLALGAGRSRTVDYGCPDGNWNSFIYESEDSTGSRCLRWRDGYAMPDTLSYVHGWNAAWKGSLGYRLGVHGPFGPFAGAEIGLHLEAPTNPATAEFDVKVGLPVPGNRPYHHSLSAGFGIGAWADNSYFCEYALSRAFGASDLFVNYRATYLATQITYLKGAEDKRRFDSRQRFINQASAGFYWRLPDIPVLPDFAVPLVILTYPLAPTGEDKPPPEYLLDDHVWDFGFGIGWNFR